MDYQLKTLQLNLSAAQQIKVKKILALGQAQLAHIRRDPTMSAVDRLNLVRAVHEYSNKQIKSVLDSDQVEDVR
jgi:hypothetical protein